LDHRGAIRGVTKGACPGHYQLLDAELLRRALEAAQRLAGSLDRRSADFTSVLKALSQPQRDLGFVHNERKTVDLAQREDQTAAVRPEVDDTKPCQSHP